MYWYERESAGTTPVISTRVRFARNLEKIPFPARLSEKEGEGVWDRVRKAYEERDVLSVSFDRIDPLMKKAYVETRLASPQLALKGKGSGLILSRDGAVSLMVNEEDHLRLQAIFPGKSIGTAFETALDWVRFGEERLPIAYLPGLGYLTSCPTNLGAAMRLSAMIHLPALTQLGQISSLVRNLNDAGFTVRGAFGENSRESGGIYQISNQMSREKAPEEIVFAFETVLAKVEEAEWQAGKRILDTDRLAVEDRVCRSLGILKYAKKMSYSEFLTHYSALRFGKVLGMEELEAIRGLDRLLIQLMPSPMQVLDQKLSEEESRDRERCLQLQKALFSKGGTKNAG